MCYSLISMAFDLLHSQSIKRRMAVGASYEKLEIELRSEIEIVDVSLPEVLFRMEKDSIDTSCTEDYGQHLVI
jgi:hypothetical protein